MVCFGVWYFLCVVVSCVGFFFFLIGEVGGWLFFSSPQNSPLLRPVTIHTIHKEVF